MLFLKAVTTDKYIFLLLTWKCCGAASFIYIGSQETGELEEHLLGWAPLYTFVKCSRAQKGNLHTHHLPTTPTSCSQADIKT